jgi:hypothetical protein
VSTLPALPAIGQASIAVRAKVETMIAGRRNLWLFELRAGRRDIALLPVIRLARQAVKKPLPVQSRAWT